MKTLIKLIVALVAVVVVLAIVGVVVVIVYANGLAKTGIEKGATYALGVETTVESASVGLFSGEFGMTGLSVANPEGFDAPHFLALDQSDVALSLASLREDTVELPLLSLTGLDLSLEKKAGDTNYDVILDNLKRFESGEQPRDAEGAGGKKFVIRKIDIRDVTVHVDLLPLGGELTRTEVPIDRIELTDVGSDTDAGVVLADLTDVIIKAVLAAVVNGGVDLPADILAGLGQGLGQLEPLADLGVGVVTEVGGVVTDLTGGVLKGVGELGEGVGKGVGEAAEGVGKAVEGAGEAVDETLKGIGNLLGGNKDKKEDDDE